MQQQYSFLSIYEDCPRRVRAIFYIMTAYSLPTWTKKKGRNIPRPLLKLQIHGQYFSGAAIPRFPSSVNEKLRTFAILGIGKRLSKYCLSGVYSVWWKQLLHQWDWLILKKYKLLYQLWRNGGRSFSLALTAHTIDNHYMETFVKVENSVISTHFDTDIKTEMIMKSKEKLDEVKILL